MRRCRNKGAREMVHGAERGFTMIEVLVALAIIAIALAASIRAVGRKIGWRSLPLVAITCGSVMVT